MLANDSLSEIKMNGGTIDMENGVIKNVDDILFNLAGQSISSNAAGLLYNIGDVQSHIFRADTVEIARFEESSAGVYRLNMLDHAVRDAKDITFDVAGTLATSGSVPSIGYDTNLNPNALRINVPTGAEIIATENNVVGSTAIKSNSLDSNLITAQASLVIGTLGSPPTVNGQFGNDGVDTSVFSGGALRNFSNIPTDTPATAELDNLTTTSINQALLPQASATLDLGSELLPWRIAHVREIEFPVDASVPSGVTNTQISKNASGNLAFNNSAVGGGFLYYFQGVHKWSILSETLSGDNILLEESLVFNDSGANPLGDGEIRRNGDSMILQSPVFQIQRATTGTFSGDFNLVKVDAAPSGGEPIYKINFSLFDSPATTIYSQIRGEIRDVTDAGRLYLSVRADNNNSLVDALEIIGDDNNLQSFMNINSRISSDLVFGVESGSIDLFIKPNVNALGISVVTGSYTIGTNGSMIIPFSTTEPTSDAEADTMFGNKNGAEGITRIAALSNAKKWIRADNGWHFEELSLAFP